MNLSKSAFEENLGQLEDRVSNALTGLRDAAIKSGDFVTKRKKAEDSKEADEIRAQHLKFLSSHNIAGATAELEGWW